MSFQIFLTDNAAYDLESIYNYIEAHDAFERANYVLDNIKETISNLADNPERGAYPKELLTIGIQEYREIYFKSYRIIYQINSQSVFVMLIADGRREMQFLLLQRLLKA